MHTPANATQITQTWTYDTADRVTQYVNSTDVTPQNYTYDASGQLKTDDQTNQSYTYDANDNRINTGYSTTTDNRLTNDGRYSYSYDAEGNVVGRVVMNMTPTLAEAECNATNLTHLRELAKRDLADFQELGRLASREQSLRV